MISLLGVIYILEHFLENSSRSSNIEFWEILKDRTSEIIGSAMGILRRVFLEAINFWELTSLPKPNDPF